MKNPLLFLMLLLIAWGTQAQGQLKSPAEFLGYTLGERFTRHHKVVEYFQHVAAAMPNVEYHRYGETYEHRPLVANIITAPENFDRLEDIRLNNLKRTGLVEGTPTQEDIAIVWLSYNVHGNEASTIEASMMTMYALADRTNNQTQEWLKSAVVILDPCINPDGRDRYANFYNQYGNRDFNPKGDAMEHHEPWPGGRPNHYLFDLNRDWAWQKQIESASRVTFYQQWMPHIHVDYHEQFYNSPYYFAPAAQPYHEVITPFQREFQVTIGKNHAKYFDQNNWLYFTKEVFDLFYPSYGDTYPTYNGAIGMTYEQAGHGFAGLGIITDYGDTLTLRDRIMHHHTTGLSTVEVAAQNAGKLSTEFKVYYDQNRNSSDTGYKTYVVKKEGNIKDKIQQVERFLDKHQIAYGTSSSRKSFRGFDYVSNTERSFVIAPGDMVISAYQPQSRLLKVFFEPQSKLVDTLTYDITAWALPYVFGLQAYALEERVAVDGKYTKQEQHKSGTSSDKPYAYISKCNSLQDVQWMAHLLKHKIKLRRAEEPFSINGQDFERGVIIATRRTNEVLGAKFDAIVNEASRVWNREVFSATSGLVERGYDFGSGKVRQVSAPSIAVLSGPQTSSLSFGEIWYFFEQEIQYPITAIGTDYFEEIDLRDYDVLVIPNGRYQLFDSTQLKRLEQWVAKGGRLILIGNAIKSFRGKEGFAIRKFTSDDEKAEIEEKEEQIKERRQLRRYENRVREEISDNIPGAIYKVRLDNSHPLAYGYPDHYFSLKINAERYAYLKDHWNVGVIEEATFPVSGFAGAEANRRLNRTLVFGVEEKEEGEVIYLVDNPLFRAFWENGKLLFANAVFMTD